MGGRLIVIPTDTVYGIGTRPDDPAATARVFQAKGRPRDLELPVLAPSIEVAGIVGQLGDTGKTLAERFWPGPLTLVVRRTPASQDWALGNDGESIGLRIPDHAVGLAILSGTGPLAVTSANISGEPTPETCGEIQELFGDKVAVYVCEEGPLGDRPSTVVDVSGAEPRILREGAIQLDEVRRVL